MFFFIYEMRIMRNIVTGKLQFSVKRVSIMKSNIGLL